MACPPRVIPAPGTDARRAKEAGARTGKLQIILAWDDIDDLDLVVLDLILPGESGMQMLRELRNDDRDRDIPVFILTSKDLTLSEQSFLRHNANSVVRKDGSWHETLLDQMRRLPQSRLMITEA